MTRHTLYGLSLCLLLCVLPEASTAESIAEADSLFLAAASQVGTVSPAESIQAFERVLDAAGGAHAPACAELAKLYLSLNTPQDRKQAERMIKRAIRLDAEDVDYQLLLGDIMWAQGFWSNAMVHYTEICDAHPDNAKAAFKVGYHALKDYVKYRDMIDIDAVGGSAVKFTWDHFAKEDRQKAVGYLLQSIQADPGFRDPYYQLGFIQFESRRPEELVRISKLLLQQYPNDKDALLFCGLGYQTMRDEQKAYAHYLAALKRMRPDERAVMESVDYIATDEEQERVAQAQSDGSGAYGSWGGNPVREAFWQQQDPLFLTPFNERRMEHYGRVAYANLAYSRPWKGVAGWRTDMGKSHIRFGKPRGKVAQRPEAGDTSATLTPHTETWVYEGFQLAFINWDGLDMWGFWQPGMTFGTTSISTAPSALSVFRTEPPRYIDPYTQQKYSVPHLVAAFREADEVRVEVAYAIPKKMVGISAAEGFVHLEEGVFLFDESWREVQRNVSTAYEMADAGTDSLKRRYLLAQHTLHVEPGTYHLAAEARDLDTKSIGTFREPQTFSFSDTTLAMSGLLLAARIQPLQPFPEGREDLEITSNPLRSYASSEPVFIYLEVYNLTQDTFGRTDYEISYRLGPPRREEIDPALFAALDLTEAEGRVEIQRVRRRGTGAAQVVWEDDGTEGETVVEGETLSAEDYQVRYVLPERNRLSQEIRRLSPAGKGMETAVTARYEGDREDDFTYLQIDIAQMPEGIHRLTVSVKDVRTEQITERNVLFRVVK